MLGSELLAEVRHRIGDETGPEYLVDDAKLLFWLNLAEVEAAERALLLEDDAESLTAAVTALTQSAGLATAEAVDHSFATGDVVNVAGANESAFNKDAVVIVPDGDHFTYAVDPDAPASATGTIVASLTSGGICNLTGVAGRPVYPLDSRVIEIRSVTWAGNFLTATAKDDLERGTRSLRGHLFADNRDWRSLRGTPCKYIDQQQKTLFVVPRPADDMDDAAIHLSVYRRPLLPILLTTEPEIEETRHIDLLPWVEFMHYSRRDTETNDPDLAAKKEAQFTSYFGIKKDANWRRKQREGSNNQVVMNPDW